MNAGLTDSFADVTGCRTLSEPFGKHIRKTEPLLRGRRERQGVNARNEQKTLFSLCMHHGNEHLLHAA